VPKSVYSFYSIHNKYSTPTLISIILVNFYLCKNELVLVFKFSDNYSPNIWISGKRNKLVTAGDDVTAMRYVIQIGARLPFRVGDIFVTPLIVWRNVDCCLIQKII